MAAPRLALGLLAALALGGTVSGELVDAPTAANFVRRSAAKATVLGHYVYIDGGELSQLVDGQLGDRMSNRVNSTLSIDISTSWNTATVAFKTIPKPGPKKADVQLWTDQEEGVFYSWGGKWILGIDMNKTELWKFTADGQGGGQWAVEPPANPSLFDDLHPDEFAAVANTGDTGFAIGGSASGWTELYRPNTQTIPGMLAFNMKTKVWQNGTTGFSPFDRLVGGVAHYVPIYGANGLVLVMGGAAPRADAEPDLTSAPQFDLANITFFDPQTKKAYCQQATGNVPPSPRSNFCATGFKGSNGRYDIFILAGSDVRDEVTYHDAYILSLPGFVWTKVPDPPGGPRSESTCVAIGNRQVLSIGGADQYNKTWTNPDPAPQGLLVFDMTAMKWTDSYDANAAAYESPDAVNQWYTNGSLSTVKWSSDDVKSLFASASNSSQNTTSGAGSNTSSSSPSAGVIAGGVIGGLVAVAIVAAIIWWLRRRKGAKGQRGPYHLTASELATSEDAHHQAVETKYAPPAGLQEVDGRQPYWFYGNSQSPPVELDGGHDRRP